LTAFFVAKKRNIGGTEGEGAGAESGGGGTFYERLPRLRQKAMVWASKGLDDATIATLMHEPLERIQRFMSEELALGRATLKARILAAQIESAVGKGDAVMLKRLGEEYCGQGVITQQGSIANAGKQVFVLNVGTPPKDLDALPPGPVRALPARREEAIDADFEELGG